jgi:hypothetical protein
MGVIAFFYYPLYSAPCPLADTTTGGWFKADRSLGDSNLVDLSNQLLSPFGKFGVDGPKVPRV